MVHNSPINLMRLVAVFFLLVNLSNQVLSDDPDAREQIGKTTTELVELRKFKAENHYVISEDGAVLNLVRVTNPLINNGERGASGKRPVLFVHGFLTNANVWIVNSVDVRPKDWSMLNVANMTNELLLQMARKEPSFKELVHTMVNFGHEVWLLNRRGTLESQLFVDKKAKPVSKDGGKTWSKPFYKAGVFNRQYWNYSMDDEAKYDIPATIDFVLEHTGQEKLMYVGHSAGGAIALMALIDKPEINKKVHRWLLLSPSMYLAGSMDSWTIPALPYMQYVYGGTGTEAIVLFQRSLLSNLCRNRLMRMVYCSAMVTMVAGRHGGKIEYLPGYSVGNIDMTSTHEFSQLLQGIIKGRMHRFDWLDPFKNYRAYGRLTAPLYDVGKINATNVAIFYGNSDAIVRPSQVEKLRKQMTVPVKILLIKPTDLTWNHYSYFVHADAAQLFTVPALRYLAEENI